MMEPAFLSCPIRGALKTKQRAADSLTFTEEKQRIDAIRYLLQRKYPKEHFGVETILFQFGHKGRNSFRTDFAVYDTAFGDIRGKSLEKRLEHLRLLAEIKRDNADAKSAKATQVKPALRLVPNLNSLGVYWDDIEQRFFFKEVVGNRESICEAPINKIPIWGSPVGSVQLTYADLDIATNLVRVFDELEDVLHVYVVDKQERYSLIQQLLLAKIHDENIHRVKPTELMGFQDFSAEAVTNSVVISRMNDVLTKASVHYSQYLPKEIDGEFNCPVEALRNATRVLAPLNILGSRTQVIQAFYMKFSKSLYKWDLAQYFTPHEVIDFIVDVVNPQVGEHVLDPACGSADFLISAFRHSGNSQQSQNCVWGVDNSPQAVQISILNMVLNGDGKTQIKEVDSLKSYNARSQQFQAVLCNPPFGTKIVEKREEVLRRFSMGYEWKRNESGEVVKTDEIREKQQAGILFAELCVRLAVPGGRIGIILPNGYLGNRNLEYVALRDWLLRHTKIAGIVAFPRFTFKKSGADVSASGVFLERRKMPLKNTVDSADYCFYVGLLESVGWRMGDKKEAKVYRRDPETGFLILDDQNEPILDTDFETVLDEFLRSPAADCFPWVLEARAVPLGPQSWSVPIEDVTRTQDRILDPKRLSFKVHEVRRFITSRKHFALGDVLSVIPKKKFKPKPSQFYRYVEIGDVGIGDYDYRKMRGWELPGRAQLQAKQGDLFISIVWGSVKKWFIASGRCSDLIVTTGFTRLKIKDGREEFWPDIVTALCSRAFRIQMRSLATGSDGLATVSDKDLLSVAIPRLSPAMRLKVVEKMTPLFSGESRFEKSVVELTGNNEKYTEIPPRKSHCSVV